MLGQPVEYSFVGIRTFSAFEMPEIVPAKQKMAYRIAVYSSFISGKIAKSNILCDLTY